MFAVQFGININNFYFGPGAGAAASAGAGTAPTSPALNQGSVQPVPSQLATAPPTPAVADTPQALPVAALPAATSSALPADLQRAGLGIGVEGLVHTVVNATSVLAGQASAAGLSSASGGGFDPAAFFAASGGNTASATGFGIPVALVPVFLNADGGFSLGPVPAFPTGGQSAQPTPVATTVETPAAVAQTPDAVVPTADDNLAAEEPAVVEAEAPQGSPAVIQVPADAFEAALQGANRSSVATELSLNLLTQDGDEIRLDFRQLDVLVQLGDDATGERDSQTERLVDISITGSLDSDERAALDAVIASVLGVAEQFLGGDLDATRSAIQELAFDSSELAELSLRLSVARSVTIDDAYGGDLASFAALTENSSEAAAVLEFFANEQRTLIDTARETLSDASSVQLVSQLLPALVSEPLDQLIQRIDSQPPESLVEPQPEPELEPTQPDGDG